MTSALNLHPDRLFPADESQRSIARRLYQDIRSLPILSPHGHTDPAWFAQNTAFSNPHELFIKPDHYLLRMLYSQGIPLSDLGIHARSNSNEKNRVASPREAWQTFAENFHLFRGTPTDFWLNHVFAEVFHISTRLNKTSADEYYEIIDTKLKQDAFKPRALFDSFNIEFLCTTESPIDQLKHHQTIRNSEWNGRVVTSYRPDDVIDPEHNDFISSLKLFGKITEEDITSWQGYLNAHRKRRADFIKLGATSTDHGHPCASTFDMPQKECEHLFKRILSGQFSSQEAKLFRGQMLTEMARMSLDDKLVMQIHPGSSRNHNRWLYDNYGRDKGADIPQRIEYTQALKPLLNAVGNEPNLTIILFTLDESNYARELAPLAGHYPCLRLGPAWWFHDSPEGMKRFREQTTETAGFYNTVGFNDDTRAFLSIPARHDTARRIDCSFLAKLVAEHRLNEHEAIELAHDLTYHLPKKAYKI